MSDGLRITRTLYNDRTLLSEEDADGNQAPGWADLAYESIRAMNHITNTGEAIPAPVAYSVLGNISGAAHMLTQLCRQLERGLKESLAELDVYDDKGDPADSIAIAGANLHQAAELASSLGDALGAAQVAINSQGYGRGDQGQQ